MRQHSASNRRTSSAHSGSLNRSHSPKMDANNLNTNNAKTRNDDIKLEVSEKLENNAIATMFANDLLAGPNFLRIPLKPIEKPTNDELSNEKP